MLTRVLIVDDDADIRATLRMVLEDAGYQVAEAASGAEALALLRADTTAGVVLLDQIMSGLSGTDMLRQIADDPVLRGNFRYILCTAATTEALTTVVLPALRPRVGVALLPKPFDLDHLLRAVADAARELPTLDSPALG